MAVSGNIFTMADNNTETLGNLLEQLGTLLGVGKRTNGRYYLEDMCQSAGINVWAKYKPFRYNNHNFNYDPANPTSAKTERDNARKLVNQGFILTDALVSTLGSVSDIESHYDSDMNGWVYAPPRGTSYNEPNRIRDFDDYNHNAIPFISRFSIPARWAKIGGNFTVAFIHPQIEEGEEYDYVTYLDFSILENAYIGIALIGKKGNRYRMTATETMRNGALSFTVPTSGLVVDNYVAYPFFSSRKLTFEDSDTIPAVIYTVPNTQMASMVLVESYITMTLTATYLIRIDRLYTLSFSVTINNNSGDSTTLRTNIIRLRYANKSWSDALIQNEQEMNVGDITIPAGGTHTINNLFDGVPEDLAIYSKLWVSLGSGTYQESITPKSPSIQ